MGDYIHGLLTGASLVMIVWFAVMPTPDMAGRPAGAEADAVDRVGGL